MNLNRKEFAVHKLNKEGMDKATQLAAGFSDFLNLVESLVGPDGREMSIVRTKLEEASFFAKKSIAIRPENQACMVDGSCGSGEPFIHKGGSGDYFVGIGAGLWRIETDGSIGADADSRAGFVDLLSKLVARNTKKD